MVCGEVKQVGGRSIEEQVSAARVLRWVFSRAMHKNPSSERWGMATYPTPSHPAPPSALQASQLGVYRAFVDNYGVAMETAEKCCQANAQFAEISEVINQAQRRDGDGGVQAGVLPTPTVSSHRVEQIKGWV